MFDFYVLYKQVRMLVGFDTKHDPYVILGMILGSYGLIFGNECLTMVACLKENMEFGWQAILLLNIFA